MTNSADGPPSGRCRSNESRFSVAFRPPAFGSPAHCLFVAACSGSGATTAPESPSSADPASARRHPPRARLTVYSGRSESLVGPLLERFERDTGIESEVNYASTSELAATILEEGDASPADVFFGQDAGALGAARGRGTARGAAAADARPGRGALPLARRLVGRRVGPGSRRRLRHRGVHEARTCPTTSPTSPTRSGRARSAGPRRTPRSSPSSPPSATWRATRRRRRGSRASRPTSRRSTKAMTPSSTRSPRARSRSASSTTTT